MHPNLTIIKVINFANSKFVESIRRYIANYHHNMCHSNSKCLINKPTTYVDNFIVLFVGMLRRSIHLHGRSKFFVLTIVTYRLIISTNSTDNLAQVFLVINQNAFYPVTFPFFGKIVRLWITIV